MERQLSIRKQKREAAKNREIESIPMDEMVDCPEKYLRIVKQYQASGEKWTDNEFPANETSLGPNAASRVTEWKRPGPETCLYEGGVSPDDIKQGALGDCYFLSALTVLGQEKVENLFIHCNPDPRIGAYCVRFYKNDQEECVIVDDIFPVGRDGNWAFARNISGTELWPTIIEKAYAKLHGSYDNIQAGKVQYALQDLTGGAPEEIRLESVQNNTEPFW